MYIPPYVYTNYRQDRLWSTRHFASATLFLVSMVLDEIDFIAISIMHIINIIPSTTDEAVLYIIYLCISYQIR